MTKYRVPARVAHVVLDEALELPDTVFLMNLPEGLPLVLSGSAAWIWLVAADGEADVAAVVAEIAGRARGDVVTDVERFLEELVGRGLLTVELPPST